ncbi:MAG TPA: SusE domain-containing protein [Chitinophagaceae bacterium]|nr:SusE domain-containing protein [Chitinophagaceae bacterium]
MKYFLKILLLATTLTALTNCSKVDELPFFEAGTAPVLSASATTIAPAPADSNKVALTLSWTNPNHATDSTNYKFVIEIDSTGKNFSNVATKVVNGGSGTSFTAKELNSILLARGYAFNIPVDMDVRVISSYANNNERLTSNVLNIKMTPYKIPPKIALPTSGKLFIVGDATPGGWNNPVPVPSQELTRIDETTFGGIFNLTGGKQYLLLPVNGDWSNKFSVGNNTVAGLNAGGDFGFNLNDNFPGPTASGFYKIIVDFQTGKFTVTPFTQQHGLPSNLFIVGDATSGGWNNPVPIPSQQFTRLTSTRFEITVPLTAGKEYLVLPENGNWGKKFGSDGAATSTKLSGKLKPDGGNLAAPDATGTYKIVVDFIDNTYTLVKL